FYTTVTKRRQESMLKYPIVSDKAGSSTVCRVIFIWTGVRWAYLPESLGGDAILA
ncbi:MAG: hypothetical protein ACI9C4_003200, partial [Paraglaciecola sp.]